MDRARDIIDFKGIMRRRKVSFLLSFVVIIVLGVAIAFISPPIYLSQSTILIEEQQIPQEYVHTTITGYVEERLQMITQQIMSRARLLEIIKQFNLYPEMRARYTTEEIVEEMREDIHFEKISTDVIDKRTGRPTAATIAFTLGYEGKAPSTVQRVANVLASLYLEQNLRSREQRATSTTVFLQKELGDLKGQIDSLQNQISEFKKVHVGELPEYTALNLQTLERLDRQLDQLNAEERSLQEKAIFLQGQMVGVEPLAPVVTEEGKTLMNPTNRLKYLRMQMVSLQSGLSEKHPDVKKLKKEIQELEAQVENPGTDDSIEKIRHLEDLKGKLAAKKGELGAKHPDVIKLSKEVEMLTGEVGALKSKDIMKDLTETKPDNPVYVNLKTQLASTEMQIKSILEERRKVKATMENYQKKIENIPMVEKEYNSLIRDHENARLKYNDISSKLMEAKVAQGMEETQRGERFTIVDPAQLPEKPFKPNRIAIALISFILALGAGVGMGAVRETLDTSVKTRDELSRLTHHPVLSVIPFMETREEKRARLLKRGALVVAVAGIIVLALVLVHNYVVPMEVLWAKIEKRMMIGL